MLSAAEFGVDEKAQALLEKYPEDTQQLVLEKLSEGVTAGKVQNASAYVVGICNGPDVLGVDDNATKMLNELPKALKAQVLEKLRLAKDDVRNPSAWVAQAVLKAKMTGVAKHGSTPSTGIDAGATALLQTLPQPQQQEIMAKFYAQTNIRNASAWIAKACIQAGAVTVPQSSVEHGTTVSSSPTQPLPLIDEQATALLATLPWDAQQEVQAKFQWSVENGGIMNPSAWMTKAAIKAGATPTPGAAPPTGGITIRARPY
eukprot:TRINITY_DN50825_c0_g1_i1.p1 TRINITY_DN50825_c0_g1~~TRINITY_DN50825_c0_g1_i1.p1  ORF type:complete len:259 (-),score=68.69 TRINITY_DN50825_c0_g1_i1:109-885(-)